MNTLNMYARLFEDLIQENLHIRNIDIKNYEKILLFPYTCTCISYFNTFFHGYEKSLISMFKELSYKQIFYCLLIFLIMIFLKI